MKSKITSLTLGNFKAFGTTQSIPVRPITLIFGANSAGKSSILQSLVFAHEASKPSNRLGSSPLDVYKTELGGDSIDLGGFDRYLHSAAREKPQGSATFGMRFDSSGVGTLGNPWYIPEEFEVQIQFGKVKAASGQEVASSSDVHPISLSIRVNGEDLIALRVSGMQWYHVSELNTGSEIFQRIVDAAGELASTGRFQSEGGFSPICEPLSKPNPGFSWKSEELRREFALSLEEGIRKELVLYNSHQGLLNFEKWNLDLIWGRLADKPEVKAAVEYLVEFIEFNLKACTSRIDDLNYLGPVREVADRVLLSAASKNEMGDKSRGSAEYNALMQNPMLLAQANRWLERLSTGLKLERNTLIKEEDVPAAIALPLEALSLVVSWKGTLVEPDAELAVGDGADEGRLADLLRRFREHLTLVFELVAKTFHIEKMEALLAEQGEDKGNSNYVSRAAELALSDDLLAQLMTKFRALSASSEPRAFSDPTTLQGATWEEKFSRACEDYFLFLFVFWSQGYRETVLRELQRLFMTEPEIEPVAALRQLTLRDATTGNKLSFRDVGCGVAQCVPVIAMLTGMREKIVCIEQPELHLHPKLQSEIGDLLVESALGGNGNTIIAETHSEHLILRILRRIRETAEGQLPLGCTPITPDDVAILYVERDGGESKIRHIEATLDGNFKTPWPGGFFEERMEELF